MWTLEQAIATAKLIEPIAREHGAHIGLTGGVLYWEGARKDVDFIVYRHQVPQDDPTYLPEVPVDDFVDALRAVDIHLFKPMHRVYKCTLGDPGERRFIDLIFADRTGDLSDDSKTPDAPIDDETKAGCWHRRRDAVCAHRRDRRLVIWPSVSCSNNWRETCERSTTTK